jgi:recombinational DNA repair protein RecT
MKKIVMEVYHSWKETFKNDKLLFFVELFSTVLAMLACATLNLHPENPKMYAVLFLYGISAAGMAWASYKRNSSFMLLLMSYYFVWSVFGILKLYF